jgi:hypothetical protein
LETIGEQRRRAQQLATPLPPDKGPSLIDNQFRNLATGYMLKAPLARVLRAVLDQHRLALYMESYDSVIDADVYDASLADLEAAVAAVAKHYGINTL